MGQLFDARLNKIIGLSIDGEKGSNFDIFPYNSDLTGNFFSDYYETPEAVWVSANEKIAEIEAAKPKDAADRIKAINEWAVKRASWIQKQRKKYADNGDFVAPFSAIQPYAILKLAGATGKNNIDMLVDKANTRKWYEVDGGTEGGYSKNPTTAAIINWGSQDPRRRFPYAFSDFVFCKYWNRIQNNRMITLRRYPSPVTDSVEPGIYSSPAKNSNSTGNNDSAVEISKAPFAPMCTAVTYFGEGTDNVLSDILKFTVGYEWSELKSDVWKTTSSQPEEGNIVNGNDGYISGALQTVAKTLGILSDFRGENAIIPTDAVGLPPDPYHDGPYENRILGPINVINSVWKRERGLVFSQDGLTITFSYVSRPIANVNNKAIMLDLLANIMLMTSARGTFFGGLHRYRTEHPAVYPWRDSGTLNSLYKGKLFGKGGAIRTTLSNAFNRNNIEFISNFAKDIINDIGAMAKNMLNKFLGNEDSEQEQKSKNGKADLEAKKDKAADTAGRAIAAKYLKGATIPWLEGAKAILTGDPIGDWHLTIGNPFNPIAMIGNLIVDKSEITFSDELGPDDFPIGFTAKITLKHAMGRDRDSVESMFNRGTGRIYSLSDNFVSSADRQTVVDEYTKKDAEKFNEAFLSGDVDANGNPMNKKVGYWSSIAPSGRDYIAKIGNTKLNTTGTIFAGLNNYNLTLSSLSDQYINTPSYAFVPWTLHNTL